MTNPEPNDDIVFIPIEEAHRKISEWTKYVHLDRMLNKRGDETNVIMITLYTEMNLNTFTKEYSIEGVVEIFYYKVASNYL